MANQSVVGSNGMHACMHMHRVKRQSISNQSAVLLFRLLNHPSRKSHSSYRRHLQRCFPDTDGVGSPSRKWPKKPRRGSKEFEQEPTT